MSVRRITIEVPAHWTDEELEERCRRLRYTEATAEQRAKVAARVELESRQLSELGQLTRKLEERMRVIEENHNLIATRSEADQLRASLSKTDEWVGLVSERLEHEITARELEHRSLSAELERRSTELGAKIDKGLRSVRGALGNWARRWAEKEGTV